MKSGFDIAIASILEISFDSKGYVVKIHIGLRPRFDLLNLTCTGRFKAFYKPCASVKKSIVSYCKEVSYT